MTAPTDDTRGSGRLSVHMPGRSRPPLAAVARRIAMAVGLVFFVAIVVRLGGDGYVDVTGDPIGMLDAVYYASVTVTTTGYGDITAVSSGARLATAVLITPARILFLILVVGTTVEVLTEQSRQLLATRRWRRRVNNHYLICGFGATGRSAAADLVSRGVSHDEIVVVDVNADSIPVATEHGYVAINGDATHRSVLHQAGVQHAKAVIVTPNRDDTAVLITLTVRELNPTTHIVTGARHQENLHLLRQGGADEVIDATAAVGRMLGLGTYAPAAVRAFDDLLDASTGLEIAEVLPETIDGTPSAPAGTTLMVALREGRTIRADQLTEIRHDDILIVLRDC